MDPRDLLKASLLDLLWELRALDRPFILAGGFGLYLKQRHIEATGAERAPFELKGVRLKPKPGVGIHAYLTPEAVAIEEEPVRLVLAGHRSTGEEYRSPLLVPQPFAYVMLKLHAFDDQKERPEPKYDYGRHHALDLYIITAMLTEPEYEIARRLSIRFRENASFRRAASIVDESFSGPEAIGILRLREHPTIHDRQQSLPGEEVRRFMSLLTEPFPMR